MSCKEIKKLLKKIEEDNNPPKEDPPKGISFVCAKMGLKEMIDTFEYLGPTEVSNCGCSKSGPPGTVADQMFSCPMDCKYGHYDDMNAKCAWPQAQPSRAQQLCEQLKESKGKKKSPNENRPVWK